MMRNKGLLEELSSFDLKTYFPLQEAQSLASSALKNSVLKTRPVTITDIHYNKKQFETGQLTFQNF